MYIILALFNVHAINCRVKKKQKPLLEEQEVASSPRAFSLRLCLLFMADYLFINRLIDVKENTRVSSHFLWDQRVSHAVLRVTYDLLIPNRCIN